MTWVWRDGKIVEKTGPVINARSDFPCPNVIRDGLSEPLQHMANGRWYDSKRAMEKADRESGCVCVGDSTATALARPNDPPPITKDEIGQAYQKVRDGYKPDVKLEKDVPTETGWS